MIACRCCGAPLRFDNVVRRWEPNPFSNRMELFQTYDVNHDGAPCSGWNRESGAIHDCIPYEQVKATLNRLPVGDAFSIRTTPFTAIIYGDTAKP